MSRHVGSLAPAPNRAGYRGKRALDLALGGIGLVVLAPTLLAAAALVRFHGGPGPVLYRATRMGAGGVPFEVLKLRTMATGSQGPAVTGAGDRRITRAGAILRRSRLDELPQLVNVLRGEMSLVGPRPEDPAFVDWADPAHRRVFRSLPGITGLAQLEFADESVLLTGTDPEDTYRTRILPAKLELDQRYLDRASPLLDLRILGRTVARMLWRGRGRG